MLRNAKNRSWIHNLLEGLILILGGAIWTTLLGYLTYVIIEAGSQYVIILGPIPFPIALIPGFAAFYGVGILWAGLSLFFRTLHRRLFKKQKWYKVS